MKSSPFDSWPYARNPPFVLSPPIHICSCPFLFWSGVQWTLNLLGT